MLIIKGHLDGLNEYTKATRGNLYGGAAMKKRNEKKVIAAVNEALDAAEICAITDPAAYPLRAVITWYDDTRRDFDNVVFAKKFIFDALVSAGIIRDDARKYIAAVTEQVITEKGSPRIEIYFEPYFKEKEE